MIIRGILWTLLFCWTGITQQALGQSPARKQAIKGSKQTQEAANRQLVVGVVAGRADMVIQALNHGANPNLHDFAGNTPLGRAIDGKEEIVKILLSRGADPNARQYYDTTPIINISNNTDSKKFVTARRVKIIKILLAHGANINAQDRRKNSALIVAAYWFNAPIVQVLLQNGANVNAQDNRGRTALKRVRNNVLPTQKQQQKAVVELLQRAGATE